MLLTYSFRTSWKVHTFDKYMMFYMKSERVGTTLVRTTMAPSTCWFGQFCTETVRERVLNN